MFDTFSRGFLPAHDDPLQLLPPECNAWEAAARELPKLLAAGAVSDTVRRLPVLAVDPFRGSMRQLLRLKLLLDFLMHAEVATQKERGVSACRIPPSIAVPEYELFRHLSRPPVLSYASYALYNWRRLDRSRPVRLGNIAILQNFYGGVDEDWFILIHVDIEARAENVVSGISQAQYAVATDSPGALASALVKIQGALMDMYGTLLRMTEYCDPYIYYKRVRPFLHGGFSEQPFIYEGVEAYGGVPQTFYGETGAQSSIVPSLDAALGVVHDEDGLSVYLKKMRDYMPPVHRRFIEVVERGPSIRAYVERNMDTHPDLKVLRNECLDRLWEFRSQHLKYAGGYIARQSETGHANSTVRGTGGTPFMQYLKKHCDDTLAAKL